MAATKDFKVRIKSITSIKKITKAMKMVAASKLRQVQRGLDIVRPSFNALNSIYNEYANSASIENKKNRLIIAISSDRGLCGGINTNAVKATRNSIKTIKNEIPDAHISLFTIGDKGKDVLSREYGKLIIKAVSDVSKKSISFGAASLIAEELLKQQFDTYHLIYSKFKSVISQTLVEEQISSASSLENAFFEFNGYEFDSDKSELLYDFYEYFLGYKVFSALLENATSEQGARMNAMDSASRNAGEMIDKLTLIYNKARQASITRELIEIISCASAVSSK